MAQPNYTALGILGLAAAGLLLYEVLRPKDSLLPADGSAAGSDAGTDRSPSGGAPATTGDAARLEEEQRTQRGELRPLPPDVPVPAVEGSLDVAPASGPVVATGAIALHAAAAQGPPIVFEVWLDFGDTKGPTETRAVQPGTTQRLDLYATHAPFQGSQYVRLYVRALGAGASVDRGALPPYLSISQGGNAREYVDAMPAAPPPPPRPGPTPGTNVGPNE